MPATIQTTSGKSRPAYRIASTDSPSQGSAQAACPRTPDDALQLPTRRSDSEPDHRRGRLLRIKTTPSAGIGGTEGNWSQTHVRGYVKPRGQPVTRTRAIVGKRSPWPIRTARRRGGGDDDSDSAVESEETAWWFVTSLVSLP
jgi:hypothetical protein